MKDLKKNILRLILTFAMMITLGCAVAPTLTVCAAEVSEETTEVAILDENGEPTDTGKMVVVFLMGAVLIIIIAVVISVVSSVVSSVASAVEDEEE